jgi:hypothetical protein
MNVFEAAIEAGKVAHQAARQAGRYRGAIAEARDATVACLVAGGATAGATQSSGGRQPICGGYQVAVRSHGGESVLVDAGYDSNGPREVWDFLCIYAVGADGQAGDRLAGGRLKF